MEELNAVYRKFSNYHIGIKLGLLFSIVLVTIYFINASRIGGDFASYLEAAIKMKNGTNIYAPPYIHLRYSYSPFWAMVLVPLTFLPSIAGVFIWLVINVFLLCRTIILLRTYFDIKFADSKRDTVLWILILVFMSRFIELNFHHAQMTIFLLWIILESLKLIDERKEVQGGILIGLGAIIKIMPIVMIPYFVYRRQFKAAGSSIITIILAFYAPILFLGQERFSELNKYWFQILRPDSSEFQMDNVGYFPHNLSALLYRLLMATGAPYLKNILALDYSCATWLVWFVIGFLILLTLFFLETVPFRKMGLRKHVLYEVSYIAVIMPLIFPHQMKYAFYFLLPAICSLVKLLMERNANGDKGLSYFATIALLLISFALCTLTTDLLLGIHFSIVTQYLKTITIGTLFLIPALMINRKYFVV